MRAINTRVEVIDALAKGARYFKTCEGDLRGYWVDLTLTEQGEEPARYRVGPFPEPSTMKAQVDAIFREAGIGNDP